MDFIYLTIIVLIFVLLFIYKYLNFSATFSSIGLLLILCFDCCKNIEAGYLITFVYVVLAFVHFYKRPQRKQIYSKFNDSVSSKAFVNVLGKVSLIVVFAALRYDLVYIALLSYGFADSLASQIGIFSKSKTISIISFKEVSPGTNGGISFLGTLLGLLGGLSLAFLSIIFYPNLSKFQILFYSFVGSFIGNLIDSVLGELIENKFKLYDWVNNLMTEILIIIICLMLM